MSRVQCCLVWPWLQQRFGISWRRPLRKEGDDERQPCCGKAWRVDVVSADPHVCGGVANARCNMP
jgi:hypothetical protein